MMSVMQNQEAEELIEAFELLGDWEQRYQFIIDLGRKLPPLPEGARNEQNRVHGCQATVYLVAHVTGNEPPTVHFLAEADAAIVSGLIGILQRLYCGRTPREILDFDMPGFMRRLGLEEHLSPTRRNGLYEMDKRIRAIARAHAEPSRN